MEKRTQMITTGAAVIAIFSVMVLLNRQTGSMFQEMLMYAFPIPMVAFSVRYGWKNSLPVLFAMGFFAFLFGTPMMVFYAGSEALIGLILGDCVCRKAEPTKTLVIVMMISAAMNVIDILVINALMGINFNDDVAEMQNMMSEVFAKSGVAVPEQMLNADFLKNMMVVALILMGMVQGFIIYQLSLLILRRLHFRVEKPKSIYYFVPAKWTGYLAIIGFFAYTRVTMAPLPNPILNGIIQTAGICGAYYLVVFGFIGAMYYLLSKGIRSRIARILLILLVYFTFSIVIPFFGLFYIVSDYRRKDEVSVV